VPERIQDQHGVQSVKFFRIRLLALSNEDIVTLLDQMDKETKAMRDDVLRICWYMRGSISYSDGMMLSRTDQILINKIIKDNMETTKKSGLPFF
jgi:hypothetical protein